MDPLSEPWEGFRFVDIPVGGSIQITRALVWKGRMKTPEEIEAMPPYVPPPRRNYYAGRSFKEALEDLMNSVHRDRDFLVDDFKELFGEAVEETDRRLRLEAEEDGV